MIIRMLQGAWAADVRRIKANQPILGQRKDLLEFMFGSEREPLNVYQPILMDVQEGGCLYCRRAIRKSAAVDHFIPWARYPMDLGHNFVLAHAKCNLHKSSHLAGLPHLESWLERNADSVGLMAEQFDAKGIVHDMDSSVQIAHWAYGQAAVADGLL